MPEGVNAERQRLAEDERRERNWKRWGPYLPERQWATVREDYSAGGRNWESFPYEHSLARAYRWGEDGLLGLTDRECRLCLAPVVWNGRDPHLKERLFGLTNPEGNHSEDVKEVYFYLDAVPTHSYLKALYKYPQAEYPYADLRAENKRRGRGKPEYELTDTGAFDGDRYWDLFVEYAKAGPDDVLARFTVVNRGPEAATLHLLPTLWFRNTWGWGAAYDEGRWAKPSLSRDGDGVLADHETLGRFRFAAERPPGEWLFTENETNPAVTDTGLLAKAARAVGLGGGGRYKDAFHRRVVEGDQDATASDGGTKAAAHYTLAVPAGGEVVLRFRLTAEGESTPVPFGDFDAVFDRRKAEADVFYATVIPTALPAAERAVARQAYAGLLWSLQFYHYVVPDWLDGDKDRPTDQRVRDGRINKDWRHLFSRDVLSVPDKWEYPAFFAWDLAFHMVPMARIDPAFAKAQLLLFLREWYLHPNGQLPAFEYDLSNVNPPVHAWACWQVYLRDGKRDLAFLERAFHKLLMNFTWWVNRKDAEGRGVFGGGFLGMDNLGAFGVRSLSKAYEADPYAVRAGGKTFTVAYVPGDMDTAEFGGNSNWRGPVWMPVNFLLIEALRKYHAFYGGEFTVECPTGSGTRMDLGQVADELGRRVAALFLPVDGRPRPCHGTFEKFRDDPHWKDYALFHEYFHGDTGRGLGASHQTGWTALVATLIEQCAGG